MMIWNRQSIPDAIGRTLLYIAEIVTSVIIKAEGNITQWCKKEACWTAIKSVPIELPHPLNSYLVSLSEYKEEHEKAASNQVVDNVIEIQKFVVETSVDTWKQLYTYTEGKPWCTSEDRKYIFKACKIPNWIPDGWEAEIIKNTLDRALDEGFIYNPKK